MRFHQEGIPGALGAVFGVWRPVARVAINVRPIGAPWGGGNQWATQIVRALRQNGYAVRFDFASPVDCVVMAHMGLSSPATFGLDALKVFLARHRDTVCVHRINENDKRKNTTGVDDTLRRINEFADFTVFVSGWLRDYHAERWFDKNRPHAVIINGADPRVFHPIGSARWKPGEPLRLVTHHWSDNWMKGFAVYQEIDGLISDGGLPGTELWVIGRWPEGIRWKAARTLGPLSGVRLADVLRSCHVYVTASAWEPGPMHFIEGAQCGLPVVYHLDGGGIVEVGREFGVGFRNDVRAGILEARECYAELRTATLAHAPSGDRMCAEYRRIIEHAITSRQAGR